MCRHFSENKKLKSLSFSHTHNNDCGPDVERIGVRRWPWWRTGGAARACTQVGINQTRFFRDQAGLIRGRLKCGTREAGVRFCDRNVGGGESRFWRWRYRGVHASHVAVRRGTERCDERLPIDCRDNIRDERHSVRRGHETRGASRQRLGASLGRAERGVLLLQLKNGRDKLVQTVFRTSTHTTRISRFAQVKHNAAHEVRGVSVRVVWAVSHHG